MSNAMVPKMYWSKVKTLRDAQAVWCPECDRIIGDRLQPFWPMNKTKAMHERGTEHKPFYVRMVEA